MSSSAAPGRWWLAGCLLIFLVSAQGHAGESPLLLEISPEQSVLTVGEPLVIQISVTNVGSDVLDGVLVSVDGFRITWYFDLVEEGCEIFVSVAEPLPGGGGAEFGLSWLLDDLEPGQTESCRVTLPQTLVSGTETVRYSGITAPPFTIWEEGEFTYTLLPVHSGVPVELEATVEQSPLQVGEPLVLNIGVTNISGETLASFVVVSHQLLRVAGGEDLSTDGCDVAAVTVPSDPPGFGLDWFVPELQPGETATCRVTFPDTPSPGTETISFFVWIEGMAWEDLAEFSYTLLAEPPPISVPVNGPVWQLLMALMVLLLARHRLLGRQG